ncbi:MAG: hypothetical protein J6328_05490 [Bacilli bacterium]|nr:hypothetical protein [Bacilli bacterium]
MVKALQDYKRDFRLPLFLSSLLHFLVDYVSIATLVKASSSVTVEEAAIFSLFYDFLAFATQPIFGAVGDIFRKEKEMVLCSIALLLVGYFIPLHYLALVLVGIGNALFHVYAGKKVMDETKRSAPLGVFISTGSLGLSLALNHSLPHLRYLFLGSLVLLGLAYYFIKGDQQVREPIVETPNGGHAFLVLPLILISVGVLIRAYLGSLPTYVGEALQVAPMLMALFVFLGKASGGFILDLFGVIPLVVASLIFTLIGSFNFSEPLLRMSFILGINLPMAFTLFYAKKACPKLNGFAFGLLAAILLLGTILANYKLTEEAVSILSVTFGFINAIICLAISHLAKADKRTKDDSI